MKPSPYFLDEYLNENGKTLFKNEKILETKKDFKKSFKIQIQSEEECYNYDFKPYLTWYVDHIISENFESYVPKTVENVIQEKEPESIQDCKVYLKYTGEGVYQSLEKHILDFNDSYVLLEGFEIEVQKKVNNYIKEITEDFTLINDKYQDSRNFIILKRTVHRVVLEGIFQKLFEYYKNANQKQDIHISKLLYYLKDTTMSDLDIPKSFHSDQTKSVKRISTLSNSKDVFEMMKAIKETSDLILENLNEKGNMFESKKIQHLTNDELIPIYSYCVIQSQLKNSYTCLRLLSDYPIPEMNSSELQFSLMTFEAVLENIKKEAEKIGYGEKTPLPQDLLEKPNYIIPKKSDIIITPKDEKKEIKEETQKILLSKSISMKKDKGDIGRLKDLLESSDSDDFSD